MVHDEILDLVDKNDNVVGQKPRSEIYTEGLSNFRVINAFIQNSKGELWIPRRTRNKRVFPLCLDMSVGGHVERGETYEEAFERETLEELNLPIAKLEYRELGYLKPHVDGVSAFMKVYEIKYDKTPQYNKNDFAEYFWLTPPEFFKRLVQGDSSKEDLPKLVKRFYG